MYKDISTDDLTSSSEVADDGPGVHEDSKDDQKEKEDTNDTKDEKEKDKADGDV